MLTLLASSGSGSYATGGRLLPDDEETSLLEGVVDLLRAEGKDGGAELLESIEFHLLDGSNDFGDDFAVLHADLDLHD